MGPTKLFKSRLFHWPKRLWLRIPVWILGVVLLFLFGRFALDSVLPYRPANLEDVPFLEHAVTQTVGKVQVTASALGPEESRDLFSRSLALRGIQPVWVEVQNDEDVPLWYLRAGTDNAWYSPYEAYYLCRYHAPRQANRLLEERFFTLHFENPILPGQTRYGFVYTRVDEGSKSVDIDLVGLGTVRSFTFHLTVPGFAGDYDSDQVSSAFTEDEWIDCETEAELRAALEQLPDCTTNQRGDKSGDPLNFVLVGGRDDIAPAFTRRSWHPTEKTYAGSVLRTIRSALFGRLYRYSPVSPLYVYGRSQDLSAQKARGDVNLRNHLRVWLTPIRYGEESVWVGQISRDIGVRIILDFPPTTHKIDPDVDEARDGLIQDLAYSQALTKFAYVKGIGAVPREAPRENLTGDPYFTDGLRAVMFFGRRPTTLGEIEALDWERKPGTPQEGKLFGPRD